MKKTLQKTLVVDFEEDLPNASPSEASPDSLKRAIEMGKLLEAQKLKIEEAEDKLKEMKAEYLRLEREDLPSLLIELGLQEITLDSGTRIEVKKDLTASITEEKRPAALKWLVDHDFGGLIKTNVQVSFGRDARDEAVKLAKKLAGTYDETELKETVHPQTLKSFVKEQLEEGNPIPLDIFSVHEFNIAKLTQKRK